MMYDKRVQLKPCPVCAKPEGAFMGSSTWGHDISCCSETCGQKMAVAMNALYLSAPYREAVERMSEAQGVVRMLRERTIASLQQS